MYAENELRGAVKEVIHWFKQLLEMFFKFLVQIGKLIMKALSIIGEWVINQIRDFLQKINNFLTSLAMSYVGEIADVITGKRNIMGTSLYINSETFGYSFIGIELALGVFLNVITAGGWTATSIAEETGFVGMDQVFTAVAAVTKIIAPMIGFAFGFLLRTLIQKIVENSNIPETWKQIIISVADGFMILLGSIYTYVVGTEDMKALIDGFIAMSVFLIIPYILKSIYPDAPTDVINTATAIIRAGILVWMSLFTIKSVTSTSPTDIVAGVIGMTDEIFIGFLTADALFSLSDMAYEYFESLLQGIVSSQGGG